MSLEKDVMPARSTSSAGSALVFSGIASRPLLSSDGNRRGLVPHSTYLLVWTLLFDPLDLFDLIAGAEPIWLAAARDHEQFVVAEDLWASLPTAAQEGD